MKKLVYIILFSLLSPLFIQCDEVLEEDPESFLVKETFYNDGSDALAALVAVYATFESGDFPSIWFMALLENRADYSNGRGSQTPISVYDIPLDNGNQRRAFNAFNEIYQGINRANAVLDNVPGIEMNETLKAQYLAEAKVLRAFFYSSLVKYWGGVPLRKNEFTDLEQLAEPRASADDTWAFVIQDVQEALPNLATSFPESQSGRVTQWAAKMLLADAFLNTEEWESARDMADDVITNGPFSLVEVEQPDDFLQIFGPDVVTHPEDIWAAHYSETNGNSVALFIHRAGFGYSANGFFAWLPVATSFVGSWDDSDLRKGFNLYSFVVNSPGDTMFLPEPAPLFRKFRDGGAPSGGSNSNNIPFFRLAEAYLIYAEAVSEANNGPDALALERLNIVRRRGYGLDLTSPSAVDYPAGLSAEAFKDQVIQERGYEFVLEMKRWNDLLRTGKAQEIIEATGKAWSDVSLLFPIPIDEINNNPAISPSDQNPGY